MGIGPRRLYVVGFGLGLIGSLATVASLIVAGAVANGVVALGVTFTFALGLVNTVTREDFAKEHSLPYRVGNWSGAVFVVGLGHLMLAVGVASVSTFG